jgi:hypothetical protein
MDNCSIVWSSGIASVQLLLVGKYRGVNKLGIPKIFENVDEALAYAQAK